MVRFARAHGSKSSNERQPEEATSWQDLQQLRLDNSTLSPSPEKVTLKEIKERMRKAEACDTEWADIEDRPPQKPKKIKDKKIVNGKSMDTDKLHNKKTKLIKKQEKKSKRKLAKMLENLSISKSDEVILKKTSKDLKKVKHSVDSSSLSKRKKRSEKELQKDLEKYDDMTISDIANATTALPEVDANFTLSKKQKRRIKHLQNKSKNNIPASKSGIVKKNTTALSKRQKRNQKRLAAAADGLKMLAPNKQVHKRRKPEEESSVIQINGEDVEVAKFNGFPVRKQDADRLRALEQQMIANNIPQKDMMIALKLERRKAEKAWARERKNVCFHCRKSGHNLSECPELGDSSAVPGAVPQSGICYKCGSTEHTHFECRVNRTQDFRFAKCFICKEQGHISNQCPDNPRGLYPKGGACKVCGDVTHLKKDCPDLTNKKEEHTLTLSTMNNHLELLDEDLDKSDEQSTVKSLSKKIVKF